MKQMFITARFDIIGIPEFVTTYSSQDKIASKEYLIKKDDS